MFVVDCTNATGEIIGEVVLVIYHDPTLQVALLLWQHLLVHVPSLLRWMDMGESVIAC